MHVIAAKQKKATAFPLLLNSGPHAYSANLLRSKLAISKWHASNRLLPMCFQAHTAKLLLTFNPAPPEKEFIGFASSLVPVCTTSRLHYLRSNSISSKLFILVRKTGISSHVASLILIQRYMKLLQVEKNFRNFLKEVLYGELPPRHSEFSQAPY